MRQKAVAGLVGLVLLAGALVWAVSPPGTVSADPGNEHGLIRVIGEAEVIASPDQARIVMGVETIAHTAAAGASANARSMDAVIRALKETGISESQISTGSYRIHSYRDAVDPASREPGAMRYRVVNQITVVLGNLDIVGKTIDTAVRAGVNQVDSILFELRDATAGKIEALETAIIQARGKGDAMARAAGVDITGIESISEEALGYTSFRAEDMGLMADSMIETPILPGDVRVTARVIVQYRVR